LRLKIRKHVERLLRDVELQTQVAGAQKGLARGVLRAGRRVLGLTAAALG
jgi:hypothetical protein